MRRSLVDIIEHPDLDVIRLKYLFALYVEDAMKLLANKKLLKNRVQCTNCQFYMNVVERSERQDGIDWVCRKDKTVCSSESGGSFFEKSNLPLRTSLILFCMWANDYDNKQIVKELDLSKSTVVDCSICVVKFA
uniref:Uncharacterized protein n=1 Tax=Ditylenchus dipsaci TaxID=166011 RepID=A0A915DQN6_9BILA